MSNKQRDLARMARAIAEKAKSKFTNRYCPYCRRPFKYCKCNDEDR